MQSRTGYPRQGRYTAAEVEEALSYEHGGRFRWGANFYTPETINDFTVIDQAGTLASGRISAKDGSISYKRFTWDSYRHAFRMPLYSVNGSTYSEVKGLPNLEVGKWQAATRAYYQTSLASHRIWMPGDGRFHYVNYTFEVVMGVALANYAPGTNTRLISCMNPAETEGWALEMANTGRFRYVKGGSPATYASSAALSIFGITANQFLWIKMEVPAVGDVAFYFSDQDQYTAPANVVWQPLGLATNPGTPSVGALPSYEFTLMNRAAADMATAGRIYYMRLVEPVGPYEITFRAMDGQPYNNLGTTRQLNSAPPHKIPQGTSPWTWQYWNVSQNIGYTYHWHDLPSGGGAIPKFADLKGSLEYEILLLRAYNAADAWFQSYAPPSPPKIRLGDATTSLRLQRTPPPSAPTWLDIRVCMGSGFGTTTGQDMVICSVDAPSPNRGWTLYWSGTNMRPEFKYSANGTTMVTEKIGSFPRSAEGEVYLLRFSIGQQFTQHATFWEKRAYLETMMDELWEDGGWVPSNLSPGTGFAGAMFNCTATTLNIGASDGEVAMQPFRGDVFGVWVHEGTGTPPQWLVSQYDNYASFDGSRLQPTMYYEPTEAGPW